MDFDELREIVERFRLLTPWVEWARRHRVALHFSDYAALNQAYVCAPGLDAEYLVVAHPDLFRTIRRLMPDLRFPITDQEIAEMIAWHKAELREPSG